MFNLMHKMFVIDVDLQGEENRTSKTLNGKELFFSGENKIAFAQSPKLYFSEMLSN